MQKVNTINHENFALYKYSMLVIYNISVEKAMFFKTHLFFFNQSLCKSISNRKLLIFIHFAWNQIFLFCFPTITFLCWPLCGPNFRECNEKAFKHLKSYKLYIFQTDSISNQMSIYIWSLKKAQHSFWRMFRELLKKEKNKSTESKEHGFGLQLYLICLVKSDIKFSQLFPFFCDPTKTEWV